MIRVILLARKPLSEKSIAENTLKHGTGGINIDRCRIGTSGATTRSEQTAYPKKENGTEDRSGAWARVGHEVVHIPKGRWPANLILQHKHGCRLVGVAQVKGPGNRVSGTHGGLGMMDDDNWEPRPTFWKGSETETVDVWECAENCPVKELGGQSGIIQSHGGGTSTQGFWSKGKGEWKQPQPKGDSGTAARFFKQVQKK